MDISGWQDTECPASSLVSAESSPKTECSVDIHVVDLVYAEGSGETECSVDIHVGLRFSEHAFILHVSARMRTRTHTHTYSLH